MINYDIAPWFQNYLSKVINHSSCLHLFDESLNSIIQKCLMDVAV